MKFKLTNDSSDMTRLTLIVGQVVSLDLYLFIIIIILIKSHLFHGCMLKMISS